MAPTTPGAIDDTVRSFAGELTPNGKGVEVPVETGTDAIPLDCNSNVERRISQAGGGKRCGWAVWQHGDRMIEGEAHCVWVAPDGRLVDVSPQEEKHIVFVPDRSVRFVTRAPQNRRKSLRSDTETLETIARIEEDYARREAFYANPPPGVIFAEPPLFVANVGRNELCRCKSGRKYKRCCLPLSD